MAYNNIKLGSFFNILVIHILWLLWYGSVKSDRIAIVGSGIGGLSAAHYLTKLGHEIEIFEKEDHLGGHVKTVEVTNEHGEQVPVDLGFLVFNSRTYPNFIRLLDELKVPSYDTDMSFSVSLGNGAFEWAGTSLWTVFAQIKNLFSPSFWGMLFDILWFNHFSTDYLKLSSQQGLTLGELLHQIKVGNSFRDYYLVPMAQCIWSATPTQILSFPAAHFLQFYLNHGLLQIFDRPQWRTVRGGAREYVARLTQNMTFHLSTAITAVESAPVRQGESQGDASSIGGGDAHHIVLYTKAGPWEKSFDKVIFATHPPDTLRILGPAAHPEQTRVLSAFAYQDNLCILHTDETYMPRHQSVWASWNFISLDDLAHDATHVPVSLSYWLNNLQSLNTNATLFETLNPRHHQPDKQLLQVTFAHPVFDVTAVNAQQQVPAIQGLHGFYFVGAWSRWGFHEDGIWSTLQVLKSNFSLPSF